MAPPNPVGPASTPLPQLDTAHTTQPSRPSPTSADSRTSPTRLHRNDRTSTNASSTSVTSRLRSASLKLIEATPPPGMWAATSHAASKAPSLSEIRKGSFSTFGWNHERQRMERQGSGSENGGKRSGPSRRISASMGTEPFPALTEEEMTLAPTTSTIQEKGPVAKYSEEVEDKVVVVDPAGKANSEAFEQVEQVPLQQPNGKDIPYPNGYIPPPKLPWKTSTMIGLKAFSKWVMTPSGFLITLYGLNVVAWGGMLFLLLCNAAPAMCRPDCNDIQSPRRIWIEIDSQILNALFCVTGFGLAPWRFRDLYWWGCWRLGGHQRKETGLRRLAGIHRGWFRLPGSDKLEEHASAETESPDNPVVPIPLSKIPDPPPTGFRAAPTKLWKMDFVVWMNMWNTFFQVVLCFYMYHYNRYDRPSWATGLFVALGCIVAGLGGIMMYIEGKAVKKIEGVPAGKPENPTGDVEMGDGPGPQTVSNGRTKT
ncbi:hypothetical protein GQ43DRAFT_379395 [Delitschia confertaspora ATCC 74209]|uniref:Alpha-L-rhamnosidase C-terminal domain-containing protein n=1 Tax=Delitschia confertaspora ATCC 74209 TaxID=1513339 RepID=A0A9P4JEW7_9PLEO|nr:hypothetical protein GQ43DRAFT_379395 [Delitschia confertaspora ATCC 74209]